MAATVSSGYSPKWWSRNSTSAGVAFRSSAIVDELIVYDTEVRREVRARISQLLNTNKMQIFVADGRN
jgi:hypothetical protein